MHNAHVDDLDIRSLRLLTVLLETVSITKTGERFGLSQPAASRAVDRLRRALNDPLIVRGSRGYVLTQRAETLRPLIFVAQNSLDCVFAPDRFDPESSTRRFQLATTDYGALTVLVDATNQMAFAAPNCTIEIAPWTGETLERLENGTLDAAFYAEATLPQDFHFKHLFRDEYVLAMDASATPLTDFTIDDLKGRRRIVMLYPDGRQLLSDDVLGDLGAPDTNIALKTPYFTSALWALPASNLIMVLPRRLAERLVRSTPLQLISLPFHVPGFNYRLIWHDRAHRDHGHQWLRKMIAE